jgi:YidC/Oxa1 family membrane protein insertase
MLLDANIFQPLIDVFAAILKFLHGNLGVSWGISIVLLTVLVRLLLVPIGLRQFHSMQRMAKHMPEIKALKVKYKDNPQRLQQETMSFYKENNISIFSSCGPLLIQWPFLIGLFWTLRGNLRDQICPAIQHAGRLAYAAQHDISLAKAAGQTFVCQGKDGSSFLFIHDLTDKAKGVEVVILLVLYIGTSIGSSMIMMMPGTEGNQRLMMLFLPVVFAFVTIRFPAGALLYYIIFNLWMIVQQSVFKQIIGVEYGHPAGDAIGLAGEEGSVSSGGGIRGLFGLPSRVASGNGNGGTASQGIGSIPTAKSASPRSRGGNRARGGATASAEPKSALKSPTGRSTRRGSGGKSSGGPGQDSSGNGNGKSSAPAAARQGPPPQSPRKKKKRSGRRR